MTKYILFTGTDCHHNVAKQLLKAHLSNDGLDYEAQVSEINVKVVREHFHEYGARIPVLKKNSDETELVGPSCEQPQGIHQIMLLQLKDACIAFGHKPLLDNGNLTLTQGKNVPCRPQWNG